MAHESIDPLELLNLVYVVLFTIGLVIGASLTSLRLFRYAATRSRPPTLLVRDVVARVTLALPFGGVLVMRALGVDVDHEWWGIAWIVASGALACVGAWIYVYYEFFIIER